MDSTGKQANNNPETEACAVKPLNSVADLKLNLISLCLKEKLLQRVPSTEGKAAASKPALTAKDEKGVIVSVVADRHCGGLLLK